MAAPDGCVIPWPIYYEAQSGERFSTRSQRFVDLIARSDPALRNASIQGLNALAPIAQAAGIVLCALGLGVTEMWQLIDDPKTWEGRLEAVERQYPETAPAVEELRILGQLPRRERHVRIGSLRSNWGCFAFTPTSARSSAQRRPGSTGTRWWRANRQS